MTEHKPDLAKIAPPLKALAWFPLDPTLAWFDGTVLLVAVPIIAPKGPSHFHYEYHVVRIATDEDYFELFLSSGDSADFSLLDDCDWYVVISE